VFKKLRGAWLGREDSNLEMVDWNLRVTVCIHQRRSRIAEPAVTNLEIGSSRLPRQVFHRLADLRNLKMLDYAALARLLIAYIDDARAVDDKEALKILKLHAN